MLASTVALRHYIMHLSRPKMQSQKCLGRIVSCSRLLPYVECLHGREIYIMTSTLNWGNDIPKNRQVIVVAHGQAYS